MADVSSSCRIRSRTDTGFVRVEAAFDTVNEAGTGNTAEDSFKVKGIGEDHGKYLRQAGNVGHDDDQGCQDVNGAHDRNHDRRDFDDALAAADEAVADEGCKDSAEDPRRHRRIIEVVNQEGRLHVKRTEEIEAAGIGKDQG